MTDTALAALAAETWTVGDLDRGDGRNVVIGKLDPIRVSMPSLFDTDGHATITPERRDEIAHLIASLPAMAAELLEARRVLAKVRAEVEPVARLAEKATPGPWSDESDWPSVYTMHPDTRGRVVADCSPRTLKNKTGASSDSRLIAAARNLIPRLARVLDGEE